MTNEVVFKIEQCKFRNGTKSFSLHSFGLFTAKRFSHTMVKREQRTLLFAQALLSFRINTRQLTRCAWSFHWCDILRYYHLFKVWFMLGNVSVYDEKLQTSGITLPSKTCKLMTILTIGNGTSLKALVTLHRCISFWDQRIAYPRFNLSYRGHCTDIAKTSLKMDSKDRFWKRISSPSRYWKNIWFIFFYNENTLGHECKDSAIISIIACYTGECIGGF